MKAIEFFSGIGGFAQAAQRLGVKVIAAYDQDRDANRVYESNYGLKPNARNLDTIKRQDIPDADLWWMSPPCTPYTVRGARRDNRDPRALSLINLGSIIQSRRPQVLLIENVVAFTGSIMWQQLKKQLVDVGYTCVEYFICPTQFGIPMKRPRVFICALASDSHTTTMARSFERMESPEVLPLAQFLCANPADELWVSQADLNKYGLAQDIVEANRQGEKTICFTSGYGKCWSASGSLIRTQEGGVRRFAPSEILKLLGFDNGFQIPGDLSLRKQWKLVGNSVDVRSAAEVLRFACDHKLSY